MLRPWQFEIHLDKKSDKALYLQIADAIINAVKSGKLTSGNALPGSRQLAGLLNVNRNTVIEALDVLIAEGWLITVDRKGTFIADILPETNFNKKTETKASSTIENPKPHLVFDDGLPDSRLAPMNDLARAYREIFNRKSRWQIMGYSNELGNVEFRKAIVQMLNFKRGMNVSLDEICITRGSQMAMYLAAHCLLSKGDSVIIENPGYKPAWEAFENAGATLLPVNILKDGLDLEEVENHLKNNKAIKAIYVTPHHQFPTTVTMSLKKRLKLIELSNQYGFTIIEDDYDNEFHFGQRPILPISSYSNAKNFIYIGTLSKIVAPALRIGYLAASIENIQKIAQHRKIIDVQGDNIMEEAVLNLINEGKIKRHLKKTNLIYKAKRDHFEKLCKLHLKDKITFTKPEGGMAFWIVPKSEIDLQKVCNELLKKGIKIMSPEKFSFGNPASGLRLGYASLTEEQMEEGILSLSKYL
ncbi:MocR-like pyridoxine biosynthesis transcription factor PdxR [Flavobacterium johnsoniae]|uniref:Transcriptional regulator, GntR family n=1 Tax=Flavobacterium johnsoniae (strain ATCC 17061 / DSM 2064 / JCM 8514 / BCRC 14874 / CCUG 350202 / NBRC 14942 / NCIMB 11054 / UW101) TaxID=376686 RepID=A5FCC5_FLAJ1|nr:PLP-dependent aminotransferase family protein [Flavobacterium johnsoniae]ABQ07146.1 transcriptional regulator, GntR family [Flavobacterium johnsoniae UW101]OXE98861.1 GntR family transcriptional regulator [Flavobacterium johnsoniae UW101]WQG81015.1 PLP-dependent aminotransferase family protein [Flavobacterium johnsoniae UW101]SHL29052.1 GntR family transcriptional regulator / MocR family aminotransferase [Flavobacterium johnsoniae]